MKIYDRVSSQNESPLLISSTELPQSAYGVGLALGF